VGRIGVTQADVNRAADELLLRGQRPTIERVRAHLGSGSPNTVTPMLDAWFKALGPRITGVTPPQGESADGVPMALHKAVQMIWDTALGQAHEDAATRVQRERQALAEDLARVREQQTALEAARSGLEEAARMASQRAEDLHAQLQDTVGRLKVVESQAAGRIQDLQLQLRETQAALESARQQIDATAAQHARQRATDTERASANERRHLQEIDRARIETVAAQKQLHEVTVTSRSLTEKLETARTRHEQLVAALADKDRELAQGAWELQHAQASGAANQRLADANGERAAELAISLAESRRSEVGLREQIAKLTSSSSPRARQRAAAKAKVVKKLAS